MQQQGPNLPNTTIKISSDLGSISVPGELPQEPDRNDLAAEEELKLEQQRQEIGLLNERIEDLKSDRRLRYFVAAGAFGFLIIWSIAIITIICIDASSENFNVPVPVLTTLSGTTIANAIGVFYVIAKGLFDRKPSK